MQTTPNKSNSNTQKVNLTPKMMVQLAAPHTWSAAVMPVALGVSFCLASDIRVRVSLAICMLVISILMQAAVNTLNDYMDFKRGADTYDNQLDPNDAVLVYNNVNPRHVLGYFFVLMGVSLVLGVYVVVRSNLITLALGLIAALIIVLYSVGKTPLSYLPLGEVVSGVVMGGFIMVAVVNVLAGWIDGRCVLCTLPVVLSIGLINFTNNTCDIEKDIEAKRHTLSVSIGRSRARLLYTVVMCAIVLSVIVFVGVFFARGLIVCFFMVLALIPSFKALVNNPLVLRTRGAAMCGVVTFNVLVNVFYALAMVASSGTFVL